jgi:hypothetical protein
MAATDSVNIRPAWDWKNKNKNRKTVISGFKLMY